ncbi:hypothetical protein L227DRAFT_552388 [Lentinus tigrinus ALCF2SS1-6]|uniref:MYND-type domain-containing protein n=2 Tax=Lentinus tigrinus TaxID=5365 RepID=A0A5C2S1C7_9APHY|nr:hypothetical protein L227DRAFT_552388 [Lentinus tigrinus ALCF2SS1-6]
MPASQPTDIVDRMCQMHIERRDRTRRKKAKHALPEDEIPRIHEVIFNRPPILPAVYANLDDLVILKQELYYDYRKVPDYRKVYRDTIRWIQEYPYEKLKRGEQIRDGPMMLELGIRGIVDCEVDPEQDMMFPAILELLEGLTGLELPLLSLNNKKPPTVTGNTFQLRKRALAACAWLNFQSQFCLDPQGSLHAIMERPWLNNAAYYANMLCWEGPIPFIVIRIASYLTTLQKRFGVDFRKIEGFKEMISMWRAYDDYLVWQADQEKLRLTKVRSAPNQYRCAADGCGVQAINKKAMRRCGGSCHDSVKPYYCSHYCQDKHWFVHRYACKQGLASPPMIDDDGDSDWVDVEEYDTSYPNVYLPDWLVWSEWNGPEIFLDFPHPGRDYKGEIIRVRSKTFGPEFLRSFRSMWQLSLEERLVQEVLAERSVDRSSMTGKSRPRPNIPLCKTCGCRHVKVARRSGAV